MNVVNVFVAGREQQEVEQTTFLRQFIAVILAFSAVNMLLSYPQTEQQGCMTHGGEKSQSYNLTLQVKVFPRGQSCTEMYHFL